MSTKNKVHMLQKLAQGPQGNKWCETADQSTVNSTGRLLARGHFVHWIPAAEPKVYVYGLSRRGTLQLRHCTLTYHCILSGLCSNNCFKTSITQRLQNSERQIANTIKLILCTQTYNMFHRWDRIGREVPKHRAVNDKGIKPEWFTIIIISEYCCNIYTQCQAQKKVFSPITSLQ